MDDDFYKERARQIREVAAQADPFIKKRLLRLAGNYDAMIARTNKPVDHHAMSPTTPSFTSLLLIAPNAHQRPKISTPDPHIIVVGTRSNLRHIVVKDGLLDAIIPFDGYARPVLFDDGALID